MNPVLSILFVLHYLNDGVRTAFISLLPFIAKDLHLSFTQVGILSASQGMVMMLLSIPAGFLGMRFGGFRVLFYALLLYSIGALGIGIAPNIWMLMIVFYLGSSGFGMFHVIGNSLVARNAEAHTLGRAMAAYTTVGDLGRISLPVLSIGFAALLGWRGAFLIIAGAGLFTYVVSYMVPRLKKHIADKTENKKSQSYVEWLSELPRFMKQRRLLLVSLAGAIDNIAASPIFIFLPFFILEKGYAVGMLGVFTAAYFAGSIGGKNILGYYADKIGTAKVFIAAEVGMMLALIIFTLVNHVVLLLLLAVLLGLFSRGTTPLISTLLSEVTHEDHYEKAYSIGDTIFGLSVIIAPVLMGILADRIGISAVFYAGAVLGIVATIPIFYLLKIGPLKKVHLATVPEVNQ